MAVLEVLVYPDQRLKEISSPVEKFNEALLRFVADLKETMGAGPPSVGIAAPQVGCFERIVLVDVSCKPKIKNHGRLIMINPEVTEKEGRKYRRKGRVSVRSGLHRQCGPLGAH